ncbi:hypothetical protein BB560_005361 [Smittium megazygosporum]|uniref:Uncharacterized protein n=1 Tax=Smittium megazygosporum TaxID=133381 RepID=A0A2T9Z6P6_9FUNG|nr:hypothetical protein BB560_005361 [Smittium megazygosporum]
MVSYTTLSILFASSFLFSATNAFSLRTPMFGASNGIVFEKRANGQKFDPSPFSKQISTSVTELTPSSSIKCIPNRSDIICSSDQVPITCKDSYFYVTFTPSIDSCIGCGSGPHFSGSLTTGSVDWIGTTTPIDRGAALSINFPNGTIGGNGFISGINPFQTPATYGLDSSKKLSYTYFFAYDEKGVKFGVENIITAELTDLNKAKKIFSAATFYMRATVGSTGSSKLGNIKVFCHPDSPAASSALTVTTIATIIQPTTVVQQNTLTATITVTTTAVTTKPTTVVQPTTVIQSTTVIQPTTVTMTTTAIATKPTTVLESTTVTSTTTLTVPGSPSTCSMSSPQATQCPSSLKIGTIQLDSSSSNKDYGSQDPIQVLCPSKDFTLTADISSNADLFVGLFDASGACSSKGMFELQLGLISGTNKVSNLKKLQTTLTSYNKRDSSVAIKIVSSGGQLTAYSGGKQVISAPFSGLNVNSIIMTPFTGKAVANNVVLTCGGPIKYC